MARWFGAKGRTVKAAALDEAFELDAAAPHVLAVVTLTLDQGAPQRYSLALTGASFREAVPGDGVWRALAVAMGEGRTFAALAADPDGPVRAALVCRPAPAFRALVPGGDDEIARGTERDLGADQSNTSVVIAERVVLKAYRRLQPGLNPDLEMTAFLSEEAAFPAVPRLAGLPRSSRLAPAPRPSRWHRSTSPTARMPSNGSPTPSRPGSWRPAR